MRDANVGARIIVVRIIVLLRQCTWFEITIHPSDERDFAAKAVILKYDNVLLCHLNDSALQLEGMHQETFFALIHL